MAILLTGGAGYIGNVVAERLRAEGEDIVVLDDLVRGRRPALDDDIHFYHGNIGDRALLAHIARNHALESCIHLAAFVDAVESVVEPAKYFENNIEKSIALIDALVREGVRRVVFSSTCATYGDPEQNPICEESRQWPKHPYGWSKLFMERVLDSYDTAYGLKFVALRYFNAAGATWECGEHREPESHLIPNVLSTALGEQPVVRVFGIDHPTPDGTPIRDYIHVIDLADAHIRALRHLRRGGESDFLNLGTGRGFSVLEVIECARKITGRRITIQIESSRAGDPSMLIADPSRAKAVIGWEPLMSDLPFIIRSAWDSRLLNQQLMLWSDSP